MTYKETFWMACDSTEQLRAEYGPFHTRAEAERATEWTYEAPFDYIHCRYLACAISDWPRLVRQAFQLAQPTQNLFPTKTLAKEE